MKLPINHNFASHNAFRNPFVDWSMILIVSILILLLLTVNGYYTFKRVTNGDIQAIDISTSTTTDMIKAADLDYTVGEIEYRTKNKIEIKKSYQFIADPSI